MVLVATQVKRRRGTTAENDAFTGAEGEITVDTEKHELRVHDGVTQGGFKIGGGSGAMPLLSFMWSDHQLNHPSWLRADTFSWQPGGVYVAAYQHLAGDIDGKTLQSETIGGTTIQFYLADDGHKVCPASEESNVSAIYNSTGVAWYYILDVANKQFKLPRTKWGFTGIRDVVGDYVPAGLPNITGEINRVVITDGFSASGAFSLSGSSGTVPGYNSGAPQRRLVAFDASRSSSIYGNSTTVQPPATEMYLYFYVGNFTQTALENTAGLNAELFNGKADVSTVAHVVTEFQAPTAENGYTWYRKYADGWVEQGGTGTSHQYNVTAQNVTFPIVMQDTKYQVLLTAGESTQQSWDFGVRVGIRYTNGLDVRGGTNSNSEYNGPFFWQVSGMAAQ